MNWRRVWERLKEWEDMVEEKPASLALFIVLWPLWLCVLVGDLAGD